MRGPSAGGSLPSSPSSPRFAFPSCISRHPPPPPHSAPVTMALCLRYPRRQVLHHLCTSRHPPPPPHAAPVMTRKK
jgi:hypothetical protein